MRLMLLALPLALCTCSSSVPVAPSAPSSAVSHADPQPYHPPPTAGPQRSGVTVGLLASVAEDDVVAAGLEFMRAWLSEDIEALMEMVDDTVSLGAGGRSIERNMLRDAWMRQFARLDFTQFTLDEVVDRYHIEVVSLEESNSGADDQRGLRSGDVLVRLRMLVTQRNRRRYFDDMLELWFRRDRGRWVIVALGD